MTTVAQARLRDAFARAGYTQAALVGGAARRPACRRRCCAGERKQARRAARHPRSPLPRGRERAEVQRSLKALDLDAAFAAGLLEGEDELTAPFAVDEWHGFYVAHDHETDVAFDHVAGISNATRTLAALTLRRPARRALDLGTGCGSQALLASRHAEHVVATDVTERALGVARLNLELNDVTNVELREGSLFEPVEGELFDLIVSNPPFVVSPDTDLVFRDAGLEGDEISRLVARGAAEHLEPGGFASMLICWGHGAGDDWSERVRGWLAGAGCDAWLVRYVTEDPLEYALKWAGEARRRPLGRVLRPRVDRHADDRRPRAAQAGGRRRRLVRFGRRGIGADRSGDRPARARVRRTRLSRRPARERLRLAPHVLAEELRWSEGGYRHAHLVTRLDEGAGIEVPVDPAALRALFALDGSVPVGDLPDAEAALPTIQRLHEPVSSSGTNSG